MINLARFFLTSLLLAFVYGESPLIVEDDNTLCRPDFADTCKLQCPNGKYVLDEDECPTCVCATNCPEMKCRANCGEAGYELDENGCQMCKCKDKANVQCPRFMCRMFCMTGFKRDENGCEYCACNESPQPCPQLNCAQSCSIGYRKDYSGCNTCECECPPLLCPPSQTNCNKGLKKDAEGCPTCECEDEDDSGKVDNMCPTFTCDLACKHGYQTDEAGCKLCACNRCPLTMCRMYCMYGFRKSEEDGCEVCECDWTPVAEKIQCDERIPCPGTRVCNLNLRLCETVDPDRVNWFLYDFEVESDLFKDKKFIQTFKNGFIQNVATKYSLQPSQIAVSSVEDHGLTSFQIMPYFNEDMQTFDAKMDQIDNDLNSHEFRAVLPAIAIDVIDDNGKQPSKIDMRTWCAKVRAIIRAKYMLIATIIIIVSIGFIFILGFVGVRRRYMKIPNRSESKAAIYDDASYHLGSTDEDFHAVHAPDGTTYVVVSTDDKNVSNEKQAMV
jgi:hypothetical protein